MTEVKDNIIPTDKWEFNKEVACCFDNMLKRSIPDYDNMRQLVFNVGRNYVKVGHWIIDIGCSNGNAIEPFVRRYGDDLSYFLCDVSEPMLNECKEKYGYIEGHNEFRVENYDIKNGMPDIKACLILSILTLQFTPIEYRQKIIQSIYNQLNNGGAFILVEKVLGNTYQLDSMMVDEYYKIKADNAYTQEQIQNKRKSLEGILVPITANWNEDLLSKAGFRQIDCFWRFLNFAGWIAIK